MFSNTHAETEFTVFTEAKELLWDAENTGSWSGCMWELHSKTLKHNGLQCVTLMSERQEREKAQLGMVYQYLRNEYWNSYEFSESKNQHFWQHDSHITSSPCICPQPSTTTAKNQQLEHTRPPTSHKNCEIIIAVYKNNCHCGLAENYIIFRTCATSKTIPNKYSGTAKACNSSRISALQWHIIN